MKKFYLLLVCSLVFSFLHATNYFVDAVNGNNGNNGLSSTAAKNTIQAAADLTNAGDTVFIMNGTYTTTYGNVLSISNSGSAAAQIVYTNYPGQAPKLKAVEATYTVISIVPGTSYISLNGLEIEGYGVNLSLAADTIPAQAQVSCPSPGSAAASQTPLSKYNGNGITVDSRSVTAGSHHITVSNCKVHDFGGAGIGFLNTDYITVNGNTVYNNSWYSIYGTSGISFNSFYNFDGNTSTYRNTVTNNTSYNNRMYVPWVSVCQITDGNGIILDIPQTDYNGKSLVANNIVFNNGGSGIHSYKMNHVDILNNVAYRNSASPEISAGEIYARNADDIKIYNNILVSSLGESVNGINSSTNLVYDYNIYYGGSAVNVVGTHSLIQDPKFVNASTDPTVADFHLQTGSLAANNGDNTHTYLLDKDGNTRPIASVVDIGAYESNISGNLNTPAGTVQSTILGSGGGTGEPGAGAAYGPYDNKTSTANQKSRHAIIYPRTLLAGNGVLANAIIYNLQFRRNTASGTQTVPDNSIIKVYVRNETVNDLGSSAFDWNSILPGSANPAVLVYGGDASPLVGNSNGFKTVPFQVPFTYTGGSLGVYVEYLQNGSIASASDILWYYDNAGSQPLYNTTTHPGQLYATKATATTGTISNTLTTNNERRPVITVGQYPATAVAATTLYYVDPINGDDLNPGYSTSTAKNSIQSAADVVNPSDTVYLMNGNHTAVVNITRSGTASQNITIKPLSGSTPKIFIPYASNIFTAMTINGSYITVDNIEMQGDNANLDSTGAYNAFTLVKNGGTAMAKYNTAAITIGGPNTTSKFPHHVTIRNCRVHDFPGGGIGSIQADYTTFENNTVYNNAWYGIYGGSGVSILNPFNSDAADTTKYKNIVRKNIAYNNKGLIPWIGLSPPALSDGNGIIMDVNEYGYGKAANSGTDYRGRTLVQNNVSFNNGGSGIHSFKADHVDIINNTAYGNGTVVGYADIFANASNDVNIVNNIMYSRNGSSGGKSNTAPTKNVNYNYNVYYNGSIGAQGLNDIIANPQFVNPSTDPSIADFTLKSTSPAIDAGNDTVGRFAATDILGVTRPVGAKPDIGAYEFTGTPTPNTNTGSNIIALQVNGVSASTPTAMYPVTLVEYSATGTATSNTIAVPSTTAGNRLLIGGTNLYDGQLILSGDGKNLTFGGYDVDPGTSSVTAYASTKVIGRLDNKGTLDISTKIPTSSGIYNGSAIRSVASQDGSAYWIAGGSSGATNGLQYIVQSTVANPSPTPVSINASNYKTVSVFNNRLYANTSGIAVYTGLPTANATTTSTSTYVAAYPNNTQYIFLDTDPGVSFGATGYDVLYIADGASNANTGVGITKFYVNSASAGGFTLAGTTPYDVTGSGVCIPAIAATINSQGKPVIYAIKGNALNNSIISIVDNGFRTSPMSATNTTITTLVAGAGTNNIFRGIALSPLTSAILPINLRLFNGSSVNGKNELQWITASEMNASAFDVERSTDGTTFTKIGFVAAKNQSLGASYAFEDANITNGIYYYRLKMVDKDGTFKYSNTVVIKSNGLPSVSLGIYPNPVVNNITISHTKATAGAMIQVISIDGKMSVLHPVATNATQTVINVSELSAGAYFLIFTSKDQNGVVKFVK